jgi:hypothetical protein
MAGVDSRDGRNGLDLDHLVPVAKHRDAQPRARRFMVPECAGDFIPRGYKIIAVACGHEDSGLQHASYRGTAVFQRDTQVLQRPPRLRHDVTGRDDAPVIAQRAGSRSEGQTCPLGRFVNSDLSDIAVAEHRPIRQDGPTGTAN